MTPNVRRQKQVNDLITDCKVFFAFSNTQFEEAVSKLVGEDKKIVSIGAGGFIPKSKVEDYINGMKKISEEFDEAMKNKADREAYIAYELNNHEAYYTRDISSTLDALGDGFTREEVMAVFDGRTKKKEKYLLSTESGISEISGDEVEAVQSLKDSYTN